MKKMKRFFAAVLFMFALGFTPKEAVAFAQDTPNGQIADVESEEVDSALVQQIETLKNVPEKESKKERKAREKALKALQDTVDYRRALHAIDKQYFVLLADRVQLANGTPYIYSLNENTNFVLVQGDEGVVQIALNGPNPGYNGLGGITLKGKVGNVDVSYDKKGNTHVQFTIVDYMAISVSLTLYKDSNKAVAIVNPSTRPGNLTLYGELVPYRHELHK